MTLWVGTSGWNYRDWRQNVYPAGLPQSGQLPWYAGHFPCVELNNSFYRLPERRTFEGWAAETPPGFRFAVKASRYLTHVRRLRSPHEPVERLVERAAGLGPKSAVFLLQLPPNLAADVPALTETLDAFPRPCRVAVEFRHDSWSTDNCYQALAERDVALVLADRRRPLAPLVRTATWGYVRFHEGRASPPPRYGRAALRSWVDRIAALWPEGDAYAFFNNDQGGWAIRNAVTFAGQARRAGLDVAEPVSWPRGSGKRPR